MKTRLLATVFLFLICGGVYAASTVFSPFGSGDGAAASPGFDGGAVSFTATATSGNVAFSQVQGSKHCFDSATNAKCLASDGTTLTLTGLNLSAPNFSGSNTGDVTLAAIGASANANGATLTAQALNLQPASASFGGVVTTGTQTFAGAKTFSGLVASTVASGSDAIEITSGAKLCMAGTSKCVTVSGNNLAYTNISQLVNGSGVGLDFSGNDVALIAASSGQSINFLGGATTLANIVSGNVKSTLGGFQLGTAMAFPTCNSGAEGRIIWPTGTGGTSGVRTKMCLCTSDGAGSPAYTWQNMATGALGASATTCG